MRALIESHRLDPAQPTQTISLAPGWGHLPDVFVDETAGEAPGELVMFVGYVWEDPDGAEPLTGPPGDRVDVTVHVLPVDEATEFDEFATTVGMVRLAGADYRLVMIRYG